MPKSKHARRLGTKRAPNSKLDPPQLTGQDASPLPAHSQPLSIDATAQQAHSQPPPRDDSTQPTHSKSLPPEAHPHPTYSQLAPSDVPSASQDLMPKSKRPRRLGTKRAPVTKLDPLHLTPPLPAHSQPPSIDATTQQVHSQPPPGDDTTQSIHSQSLPPDAHPHPTYSQLAPRGGPSTSQDSMPRSKHPRWFGTKRAPSNKLDPPCPTGQDFPSLSAHSQSPSGDATIQLAHSQPTPRDDTTQMPMSQRRRRLGTKRASSTMFDPPQSTGRDAPPLPEHSQPPARDVTTQQAHSQPPPRDDTTQPTYSRSFTPNAYPHPTYSQLAPRDGPSSSQDPMPQSKHPRRVGTKRSSSTKLDPPHPTDRDSPPLPAHSRPPSRDAITQPAHSRTPPRDDTTQPTYPQSLPPDADPHPPYSQLAPGDGSSTSQDPVQGNEDITLDLILRQIINELLPTPSLKIPTTNCDLSPNGGLPTNKSLRKIPKSNRPKLTGIERAPSTKIDPPHPTRQDAPPLLTHSEPPSRASITKHSRSQRTPRDAATPTHSQSLPQDVHPHPHPTYSQDASRDGPSTSQDAVQDTQLGSDTDTDDTETYYTRTSYKRTNRRSSWACQVIDKDDVTKGKNFKVKQSQQAHSQPPPRDATIQPTHSQSSPQDVHTLATYSLHAPRDGPSTSQDPGQDTQLGSDTETDDTGTDDTETNVTKTNHKQTKQRSSWACKVIDKDGVIKEKNLKVRQVWRLKYEKVVVECDKEGRPVEDVGGLFSGVVGRLARTEFPIDVKTWRHITNSVKDDCIDRFILPYFHFENEKLGRRFAKQALGRRWRDYRLSLYNTLYDPSMSKEQNIDKNCPHGITKQEWAGYIDIRDDKKHKEMCKKNAENRSKQFIPHTGGSMSFARKKRLMEKESGQLVGRVKLWDATHRKKNGTYVNDKAKEVADKLNDALSQEDPSRHSIISPDDALGKVFGREHPGRVRGLGFGVCPTSVFENTMQRLGGVRLSYISSSSQDPKIKEEVQTLKSQLNETQDKLNQTQDKVRFWESAFLSYIQEKEGYIPHQFANLVSSTQQIDERIRLQNPNSRARRSFNSGGHDETKEGWDSDNYG